MRRSLMNSLYENTYRIDEEQEYSPAEEEINGPETKNGIVINALNVKIRKEPSFESDTIGLLRKGDEVTIMEKINDFYNISTKQNIVGYVSSDFIKEG